MPHPGPDGDRLIKLSEVCLRLGIGRTTFYAKVWNDDRFPPPVRIGDAVRYSSRGVDAYIAGLVAAAEDGGEGER